MVSHCMHALAVHLIQPVPAPGHGWQMFWLSGYCPEGQLKAQFPLDKARGFEQLVQSMVVGLTLSHVKHYLPSGQAVHVK